MLRVVDPGIYINDGWGGGADISVGEACDSEVVHLLNPFGGSVNTLRGKDLKVGIVAIVLDVAGRGSGESVFVVQDLFLQAGEGIVEGVDRLLVVFFPLLDGLGKTLDDVGEEGDSKFGRIALEEIEGGPRGEWRALVARVVEHASWVKEWQIQGGAFGWVNGLECSEDCSPSVVGGGLWRGVRGRGPKSNGERRGRSGGNERGNRTSCSGGQRGFDRGVNGVV